MRISKSYWVWGLFTLEDKIFLDQIKAKVQKKLKSPFFETHITLAGPYQNIDNLFLNKLRIFGENNSPILLNPEGYSYKQEIFKTFYVSIENSENLKKLRRNIFDLNKFDLDSKYFPHISLSYGEHEIKEKKELIKQLPKLNRTIKLSKIVLVNVNEDINLWKIIQSFKLNKNTFF